MAEFSTIFDLCVAQQNEAQRRLDLLGELALLKVKEQDFVIQSRRKGVPTSVLKGWQVSYVAKGLDGLLPRDWTELSGEDKAIASVRYMSLKPYFDRQDISDAELEGVAVDLKCGINCVRRWLKRYWIGGLWELTPSRESSKAKKPSEQTASIRDIGALENQDLQIMFERRSALGDLADKEKVSDSEVIAQAKTANKTPRTIWRYLSLYRRYGLQGLAPKRRSDAGAYHNITSDTIDRVRALALSNPGWPLREVYKNVLDMAAQMGEPAPSMWQVRRICNEISPVVKLLADKRDPEFRNRYRFTYPLQHNGVVYQIDHNRVDVLVRDLRKPKYRSKSGEVRPWLTLVIDAASRRVIAFILSYDHPNRHTVASVIRKALLAQRGGIPLEIWVDNGKDLVSYHVAELVKACDIDLHICDPHQPQQRGIVERFFGTLNTRLWSTVPGYVDSNTVDRNPSAKAELTLQELEALLLVFISAYNAEPHTSLDGMSPDEYWDQNCRAMPVDDVRTLDILLLEPSPRKVGKEGIDYDARKYWHDELATIVSQHVMIRADTRYETPDEIEVYSNDRWLCTAVALDSERGRNVSHQSVADAQQRQRDAAQSEIANFKAVLKSTKERIAQESAPPSPPEGRNPKVADESGKQTGAATTPRSSKARTSGLGTPKQEDLLGLVYRTTFVRDEGSEG